MAEAGIEGLPWPPCVPGFRLPLPVKMKPLHKPNTVGGAEKPVLGSCPQGEDSLMEGGKMGISKNSSARRGSGTRPLGVKSWGSVTLLFSSVKWGDDNRSYLRGFLKG